jgi:hypothetical protein
VELSVKCTNLASKTVAEVASGILLLDPSLRNGYPLWGGHENLDPPPSIHKAPLPPFPPRTSLFDDVAFYLEHLAVSEVDLLADNPLIFARGILSIMAHKWLVLIRYLDTRLNQTEWELEHPDFRTPPYGLDNSLRRLHPWRRGLPTYRAMVKEVLGSILAEERIKNNPLLLKLRTDFLAIDNELERLDLRIQSMINVALAITSLEENKRAAKQGFKAARLTYLAVFFVPMAFVSSFFSMSPQLSELKTTFWIYFIVALPATLISLAIANWGDFAMIAIITKVFRRAT